MSIKLKIFTYIYIIAMVFILVLPVGSVEASSDLILTWSADTSVPYFYQGKSLASQGSIIVVSAVLLNKNLNAASLDFRWSLDDKVILDKSGKGKSSFVFTASESSGHAYRISVIAINSSGAYQSSANLEFRTSNPKTAFYKHHSSNFSNFYQAVPDIAAQANEELNFIAWPLFFNAADQSRLEYKWSFGSQVASQLNTDNPNLLNLKIGPINSETVKKLLLIISDTTNKYSYARYQNNITLKP